MKKLVVGTKVEKTLNKNHWKNGVKKSGKQKMNTKNVVKLKLLLKNIRRVNNGIFSEIFKSG